MTLIGGFKANDEPVLVGDFLITSDRKITGLKKKVVMLSDNCVLGWTGHLLVAEEIYKKLDIKFRGRKIRRSELEEFFKGFAVGHFSSLSAHFVGWIIDEEASCFLWNSSYPHDLFYGDPKFDGSGEPVMAKYIGPTGRYGPIGITIPKGGNQAASAGVMWLYSALMGEEVLRGPTSQTTFGFGYEFLMFKNGKFEYLSNILYISMICLLEPNGTLKRAEFASKAYKYIAHRTFAELAIFDVAGLHGCSDHFISPPGLKGTRRNWIRDYPEVQKREQEIREKISSLTLKSDYYCVDIRIVHYSNLLSSNISTSLCYIFSDDFPIDKRPVKVINQNGKDFLVVSIHQEYINMIVDRANIRPK